VINMGNKEGGLADGENGDHQGENKQTNEQTTQPTVLSQGKDMTRASSSPLLSSSIGTPIKLPKRAESDDYHGASFNTKLTVDDFELLKVVGKGSFGKVMQVKKKDTDKIYAMKVLKKSQLVARKQVAHTQTERKVLEEIDHPFIVSLRYAFQSPDKLYMIVDYFTGGELFFHLRTGGAFSEERGRFYAAEMSLALVCLHQHNIIYRDLKPENVLLDGEGHIKLTDFGLSKDSIVGNQLTHTFCGTPEYLAPEVIHGIPYGKAVDWWSLGTLTYEMLTGLPPFYNENLHVMYEKIIKAKLEFPSYLSAKACDFLGKLLERNPKKRLGGIDSEEVKNHPWFQGIDWDLLASKKITPPFIPTTTGGASDTTNIDDEFKKEPPKLTPSGGTVKVAFDGFTFNEETRIKKDSIVEQKEQKERK